MWVAHRTVITRAHQGGRHWARQSLIKLAIITAIAVIALIRWDVGAAFFLALLAASVMGLLDGRISITLGLLSLAVCPLLLIADHGAWLQRSSLVNYYAANAGLYSTKTAADTVVVWAYYFLCIGVVAKVVHYYIAEKGHGSEKPTV